MLPALKSFLYYDSVYYDAFDALFQYKLLLTITPTPEEMIMD